MHVLSLAWEELSESHHCQRIHSKYYPFPHVHHVVRYLYLDRVLCNDNCTLSHRSSVWVSPLGTWWAVVKTSQQSVGTFASFPWEICGLLGNRSRWNAINDSTHRARKWAYPPLFIALVLAVLRERPSEISRGKARWESDSVAARSDLHCVLVCSHSCRFSKEVNRVDPCCLLRVDKLFSDGAWI